MKIKIKKKFVVFLSLYATFFISYFTLTTFARYTSILYRDGLISVAKWDISVVGNDDEVLPTMFIGDSNTYQSYELSITSKSETPLNYSAIISGVPNGVKIQVDDDVNKVYSASESDNSIINIPNLGSFTAENINETHNHKLTIQVPSGIEPFSNKELTIDVIFTQVNL